MLLWWWDFWERMAWGYFSLKRICHAFLISVSGSGQVSFSCISLECLDRTVFVNIIMMSGTLGLHEKQTYHLMPSSFIRCWSAVRRKCCLSLRLNVSKLWQLSWSSCCGLRKTPVCLWVSCSQSTAKPLVTGYACKTSTQAPCLLCWPNSAMLSR